MYIRYFWQGNHHTYGHIRCAYTVLANPTSVHPSLRSSASAKVVQLLLLLTDRDEPLCFQRHLICAPIATQLCLQLTIQAEAQSRHLLVPFQKAPHPCTHLLHCIAARNWVEAQPKLAFACTFPTHTHTDTHTQTHSHTHTLTLHCSSPSA